MALFARKDPIADATAVVVKLEAQRARLGDRLAGAVAAGEAAQRARREALLDGDPDAKAMAALDLACARAAEARAGIEEAARALAAQLEEATRHRDGLQDAARRAEIAAEAERRADALDAAAEALAAAAQAFGAAGDDLVTAMAEHGVRVDNPLSTGGSTTAALAARPVIMAALRMAAPNLHPKADGLGVPYDSDPVMVARRAQSGRLRDHAEDVRAGTVPAAELPRPAATTPVDPSNPLTAKVEMVRGVFRVPFCYIGAAGRLQHGGAGDVEVPVDVLRVAVELGLAVERDSRDAAAIVREVSKPPVLGYMRTLGRPAEPVATFIDVENGEIRVPSSSDRPSAVGSADARSTALLGYYAGRRA